MTGTDDDRGIVGEPGQKTARPTEQVLHLAVHVREELAHLVPLVRAEGPGPPEVVDEEAVPLVGGDPSRTGVGLREVAVTFEGRHLAAHRRRRHLDAGIAGDVGRADGLGGLDVLRDHRVQDGGLAVIELGVAVGFGVVATRSALAPHGLRRLPRGTRGVLVTVGALGPVRHHGP